MSSLQQNSFPYIRIHFRLRQAFHFNIKAFFRVMSLISSRSSFKMASVHSKIWVFLLNFPRDFDFFLPPAECGGQEEWPCGKPCPRSCSDFHGDTECLDPPGCQKSCGCPGDLVLQDGECISREECRCKGPNNWGEMAAAPPTGRRQRSPE